MPVRLTWVARALLFLVLCAAVAAPAQEPTPSSDTDARIAYYKARLGGPGTYPAYARLGAAYIEKARETGQRRYFEDAERYLLRSLGYQRNFEALHWLAVVYLERHQFRQALAYAEEAAETLPGDSGAQGTLFDIYFALGDTEKAAAVADKLLAAPPGPAGGGAGFAAYARLASLRHYQGELAGAVEMMERACADAEAAAFPAEARAWCQVRLGSFQLSRCEVDKAEEAYQRALEWLPDYYQAVEHLAELRAAQGKAAEAIALYSRLVKRSPEPRYRVALADLYDLTGQSQQARRERQRAVKELRRSVARGSLAPPGAGLADLRALALLLLREEKTAAEGLRLAEQDWENRRDAYTADTLAWAYFRNGRYAEALEAINAALRPGLKDVSIFFHAALIYHSLGQQVQAREFLEHALACPLLLSPADRPHAEKLRAELKSPPQ